MLDQTTTPILIGTHSCMADPTHDEGWGKGAAQTAADMEYNAV